MVILLRSTAVLLPEGIGFLRQQIFMVILATEVEGTRMIPLSVICSSVTLIFMFSILKNYWKCVLRQK